MRILPKSLARRYDRKRHERLHDKVTEYTCRGDLKPGGQWGCGREFTRRDALNRHLRPKAGRGCVEKLADRISRDQQSEDLKIFAEHIILKDEVKGTKLSSSRLINATDNEIIEEPTSSNDSSFSTQRAAYTHATTRASTSIPAIGNIGYLHTKSPVSTCQEDLAGSSAYSILWCEAEGTTNFSTPATSFSEFLYRGMDDARLSSIPLPKATGYDIDMEPMASPGPSYANWWTTYVQAMAKASTSISD